MVEDNNDKKGDKPEERRSVEVDHGDYETKIVYIGEDGKLVREYGLKEKKGEEDAQEAGREEKEGDQEEYKVADEDILVEKEVETQGPSPPSLPREALEQVDPEADVKTAIFRRPDDLEEKVSPVAGPGEGVFPPSLKGEEQALEDEFLARGVTIHLNPTQKAIWKTRKFIGFKPFNYYEAVKFYSKDNRLLECYTATLDKAGVELEGLKDKLPKYFKEDFIHELSLFLLANHELRNKKKKIDETVDNLLEDLHKWAEKPEGERGEQLALEELSALVGRLDVKGVYDRYHQRIKEKGFNSSFSTRALGTALAAVAFVAGLYLAAPLFDYKPDLATRVELANLRKENLEQKNKLFYAHKFWIPRLQGEVKDKKTVVSRMRKEVSELKAKAKDIARFYAHQMNELEGLYQSEIEEARDEEFKTGNKVFGLEEQVRNLERGMSVYQAEELRQQRKLSRRNQKIAYLHSRNRELRWQGQQEEFWQGQERKRYEARQREREKELRAQVSGLGRTVAGLGRELQSRRRQYRQYELVREAVRRGDQRYIWKASLKWFKKINATATKYKLKGGSIGPLEVCQGVTGGVGEVRFFIDNYGKIVSYIRKHYGTVAK